MAKGGTYNGGSTIIRVKQIPTRRDDCIPPMLTEEEQRVRDQARHVVTVAAKPGLITAEQMSRSKYLKRERKRGRKAAK